MDMNDSVISVRNLSKMFKIFHMRTDYLKTYLLNFGKARTHEKFYALKNISIDIKNTGEKQGKEVVQVYVCDIESRVQRPPRELKAFRKVSLLPGETKTIDFILDKEALSFYDPAIKQWADEPGEFEIQIGSSSRDIRARAAFVLVP